MKLKQNRPVCEHCGYDERRPNEPHQLPPATVLQGKYLIGRALGQGGFGITYLGWDINLDIPVAIKEYYPQGMVTRNCNISRAVAVVTKSGDTSFVENRDRFLREARTLAKLEDVPEVVQVKNFFEENNTAYIVMGYVKGITLKEYMNRNGGKLRTKEALRLLEPMMEAMGQVHALGLVHRDISPDNIMLQPNKRVRLIDFGAAHVASVLGGGPTQVVLKLCFAPPEQYQSNGNLGPWTDVYAICATIYHCITGLLPPTVADRFMGGKDFEWNACVGLSPWQIAALRQGLQMAYTDRIQTVEELCRKFFHESDEQPQNTPVSSHKPPRSNPAGNGNGSGHGGGNRAAAQNQPKPANNAASQGGRNGAPVATPGGTVIADSRSRVLMEHSATAQSAFRTGIKRSQVVSITMLNTVTIPDDAVDASQQQDGSVRAWVKPNGNLFDLYLAANGNILAPGKCHRMFAGFSNLKKLDLTGFDTSGVTDMSYMFYNCPCLTGLDVTGFRTAVVTDMGSMFSGCACLEELDVSGFDTGLVTNMSYMFYKCSTLTYLNVSGFNTSLVTDMSYMFYKTDGIQNVDGNFDVSNAVYHSYFMDLNDTFNGSPWKEMFRQ